MSTLIATLSRSVRHPIRSVSHLYPKIFWPQYARKVRQQGLSRFYLILSLDCDTIEDIDAAEKEHSWLQTRGLKATYAVPGQQLERGYQYARAHFTPREMEERAAALYQELLRA